MSDDRQAVLTANEAFYRAFEKKNIEAMSQIWSQGTGCSCIHPGRKELQGWSEISSSWEKIFRNLSYIEIETKILSADVSENLAYVVLVETVLQISRGRKIRAQSMATNLFECMSGKWYLIHHHGSPIMQ